MGYIKHHTIVVTGWGDSIKAAHKKAIEVFIEQNRNDPFAIPGGRLVSEIISGLSNGQDSFFIAPDGSKEGWDTSENCNDARNEFLNWIDESDSYCEYIEVIFGGDDEYQEILRSK